MDQDQREELHAMSPEEQQAAMGLPPEAEAEPGTGPTSEEADLPDLPPNQQLKAMGVTPEPEAEQAPGTTGLVEPELEAYAAQRDKQRATDANGCC